MIFLIGMPAAGKSYLAKQLAEKSGYKCIDIDEYIEEKEGVSISEIFRIHGEAYFRKVEAASLSGIVNGSKDIDVVVACGGGTPIYGANLQLMKAHGCVVYIEVELSVLAERIKQDNEIRPMFSGQHDIPGKLLELYRERLPFYEQADHTVNMDYMSISKIEKIITLCTGRQ